MSNNIKQDKRPFNLWKWAFILLILSIIFFIVCTHTLFQEDNFRGTQTNDQTSPAYVSSYEFEVEIDKVEVENLVNDYLQKMTKNKEEIRLKLTDRVEIYGNIEFLNLKLPYVMKMNTEVLPQGDLQLKVIDFQLTKYSLPRTVVMNLLERQLNLPPWIVINSNDHSINIYLSKIKFTELATVELLEFNLPENKLKLRVNLSSKFLK